MVKIDRASNVNYNEAKKLKKRFPTILGWLPPSIIQQVWEHHSYLQSAQWIDPGSYTNRKMQAVMSKYDYHNGVLSYRIITKHDIEFIDSPTT